MKFLPLLVVLSLSASLSAVEIVAHRGFSSRAPENTVAAFKLAWEQGADACELDLLLTKDGEIAVLHDEDAKRTTKVPMLVANSSLAELQALDAGSWKKAIFKGEKIPSLEESLASMPLGTKRFLLEVKSGPEVVPVLAKKLSKWRLRGHQLCIIAFNRTVAQECKKALPWIKVYRLSSEKENKKPVDLTKLIADTKADGLDGLDLGLKWKWSEAMVKQIKDAGLELHVWTVNRPGDVKRLAELGVDGITTDDPVMARNALEKK
ncbi:glycerophosphoryl diester phosphodiesterase [Prosthecobacter fusiformis]|uniref:Glycerophosphoryl diester phosphodiesterase n=1 Tax=Prosthecobacter fusiformis TaxID=48464 RepID=A0A4R7RME0_9BACT|nr:glycerophosphodiester phosphodiesterase family protein [Prosthecobacter fusiformis]TDU66570.1 glycerophosphoryl diester phosphodiesterase [Prosthecobacter fusiformis]